MFAKCESALQQAVTLYSEEGRFNMAAKNQKELAELYENERMMAQALDAYNKAADLYEGEGAPCSHPLSPTPTELSPTAFPKTNSS